VGRVHDDRCVPHLGYLGVVMDQLKKDLPKFMLAVTCKLNRAQEQLDRCNDSRSCLPEEKVLARKLVANYYRQLELLSLLSLELEKQL
jgi:hypothetical protein